MADLKISQLNSIVTVVPSTDVLPVVQGGTTYKVTPNQLLGAGGVATLASAAITGDLTVRTTGLTVNSSGVGVGTSSQSSFLGNSPKKLVIGDGTQTPALTLYGGSVNVSGIYYAKGTAGNQAYRGFFEYDHSADALAFGIAGSTAMTLNSTGLGVGVSPSAKLHSKAGAVTLGGIIETGGASSLLSFADVGTSSYTRVQIGSIGNTLVGMINGVQAMTLDANGRLLIGKTASALSTVGLEEAAGGYIQATVTSDASLFCNRLATDGETIKFYRQTVQVGNISVTTTATAYNTSSDYRLKESVQPLVGGLTRVNALKPSVYNWKSDGSAGEGFLAHELAEVVPAAVTGEKDAVNADGSIKPQGVDMSRVVPILVAAIQELTARVQTLEAR